MLKKYYDFLKFFIGTGQGIRKDIYAIFKILIFFKVNPVVIFVLCYYYHQCQREEKPNFSQHPDKELKCFLFPSPVVPGFCGWNQDDAQ